LQKIRGARIVAQQALMFSRLAGYVQPVLVNGAAGIISWLPDGRPFSQSGRAGSSKSMSFVILVV
jgi:hypothetical protein